MSRLKALGAEVGGRYEDPLGDSAWIPFALHGQNFELESDAFCGLTITCLGEECEAVIRSMVPQLAPIRG